MLEEHLLLAEEHIATGKRNIAKQRSIIHELERDGHDTAMAKMLLAQFEELEALHMADRNRIMAELAEKK
jgi:hypothetical protein